MEQYTQNVIEECAKGTHEGTMSFPTIVAKLIEVGVEQYHADLLRAETTYYLPSGDSHIVSFQLPDEAITAEFEAAAVVAAVRASQQKGIYYHEFLVRVMKAGCIGYIACLSGQRVIYYGRKGDMQIEYFPGSRVASLRDASLK